MRKIVKCDAKMMQAIVHHTKVNMKIRKKLKVMIHKLPVPDVIERQILDFIGVQQFKF
jgi:hypothetical protein